MTNAEPELGGAIIPSLDDVSIRPLAVAQVFAQLDEKQKLYAHYLSKAAWAGATIIHSQVSYEAPIIFELILELHQSCHGNWTSLIQGESSTPASKEVDLNRFLLYSALFLFNAGNYYGYGDKKFVPGVSPAFLQSLVQNSSNKARRLLEKCIEPMLSPKPSFLGFPGNNTQSGYYIGSDPITREEIKDIDQLLKDVHIGLENTHILKNRPDPTTGMVEYEVLQASTEETDTKIIGNLESGSTVRVSKGDHAESLQAICHFLKEAQSHAENKRQRDFLGAYIDYFATGNVQSFKRAQALIETRAEFEGIVALTDKLVTEKLGALVRSSQKIIYQLPWITVSNKGASGMGPFESDRFDAPDFVAIHALAYCSSVVFLGVNLPNYDDIRDKTGFKNIMIANRNRLADLNVLNPAKEAPLVDPTESIKYLTHEHYSWDIHIALHEFFGHGTGNKLMAEQEDGSDNFDISQPPIDPSTAEPIRSWYKKGETVSSIFGNLASTLNECRADCVALYLITDKEVLSLFRYNDESDLKADHLIYNDYLHVATMGVQALLSYDPDQKVLVPSWGQDHERGYFAILQVLLAKPGLLRIDVDKTGHRVTVRLDGDKVLSEAKAAIGDFLLKLHMWRITADVEAFSMYYESLTSVTPRWLEIRKVIEQSGPKAWIFISANTFITAGGNVDIKEYEQTPLGVIESWADRFPHEL